MGSEDYVQLRITRQGAVSSARTRFFKAAERDEPLRLALVTLPSQEFQDNSHFNLARAELVGAIRHAFPGMAEEGRLLTVDPTATLPVGEGAYEIEPVVSEILRQLENQRPHVIGLSAKLGTNRILYALVGELLRSTWASDAVVVVGGTLPTFSHRLIAPMLPEMLFTTGEGEQTLVDLLEQLRAESPDFCAVRNVVYVENGREVTHPKEVLPLEEIHWLPALEGLKEAVSANKTIVARSSVGCSAHCTFCAIRVQYMEDKKSGKGHKAVGWRQYPPERTAAILKEYERAGVSRMTFVDDEFGNEDFDFLNELADVLVTQSNAVKFDVALRLDVLSERKLTPERLAFREGVFRKLMKAGLYGVFVGLESGVDAQLRRYGKNITVEELRSSIGRMLSVGLNVTAGFIAYDPLMRKDEVHENMDFLESEIGNTKAYLLASRFMNRLMVQQGTPYLRLMEHTGLIRGLQENMSFYDTWYVDPRVNRIADESEDWFYEFLDTRFAVRDISRTPLYGRATQDAQQLMSKLIAVEIGVVRALLAVFPDDEWDHRVRKLPDGVYRDVSHPIMKTAREKWLRDALERYPQMQEVLARFREMRRPIEEEFVKFLRATLPVKQCA